MELDEVAQAGAAYGEVTGVLAAESVTGERSYLVTLGEGEAREWLLLDAAARPVTERSRVEQQPFPRVTVAEGDEIGALAGQRFRSEHARHFAVGGGCLRDLVQLHSGGA